MLPRVLALSLIAGVAALPAAAKDTASAPANRAAIVARIDELLAQRWKAERIEVSPPADDSEFLRRAALDLTGVVPRVSESRAFLSSGDPDKRTKLIESLVRSPSYATHMANTWRAIMLPGTFDPDRSDGIIGLQEWLRQQFASGKRYDHIVADLFVASEAGRSGPALFYTALQVNPEELATSTARIFLGMQIGCAQCHDHPFAHWKQRDFWGYAAFFARVRPAMSNSNRTRLVDADEGEVYLPNTRQAVPPKFPAGAASEDRRGDTRRRQLAIWVVSRDNPFVARAAVNLAWAHLFGRGLVEPVDDLGDHNPPSHPELLDELAQYFAASGYDLRELLCVLASTRAYQLSSGPGTSAASARRLFARMPLKTLTSDQLYDCIERLSLADTAASAAAGLSDQNRQAFLIKVQASGRSTGEFQAGSPQALRLMHGQEMRRLTDLTSSKLLRALDPSLFDPADQVEALTLAALCRYPSSDEREQLAGYLRHENSEPLRRQALSDVLWTLVNSAEFALVR